jgi:oligosaccharyltransferase complex subunit beta
LNAKGNILLTLASGTAAPSSLVSLLTELEIALPTERTGSVADHFNYDVISSADSHDVLLLPVPRPTRSDVSDLFASGAPSDTLLAFPHGVGAALGSGPLLTPIVRAPRTAYSYNPKEQVEVLPADELFGAGSQLALVAGVQARNSARFALVGSAEMLSDTWFDASVKKVGEKAEVKTYNREFAKRVTGWTFQEIGVLRVNWVEHRLDEAGVALNESNPKMYRIKNDVVSFTSSDAVLCWQCTNLFPQTYTISVSEYKWDKWTGFTIPPNDDLQLEFSMLSPFHRLPLTVDASHSTPEATAYTASFRLPDQHGIYNFKVNYKRPLLTNVDEKHTVSVRHMAHDEWPRSYVISGAYPWIAGIGATITAWLAFVVVWMFSKPTDKKLVVKKTQ